MPNTQNSPTPITVPVAKAKELTGLGLTTIYAKLKTGELRSTLVGSRRLIFADSLRALLEKGAR